MRLKSVYISQYKNLKNFTLDFDGSSFIDVFVGKNGTGKSNLFEALIEIFRHLYEYRKTATLNFDFKIKYEIDNEDIDISYSSGTLNINDQERKTIAKNLLPGNILVYYSGHNKTVTDLVEKYRKKFHTKLRRSFRQLTPKSDSPRFIGIGSEYKNLLLAIMLMQKEENRAREFIHQKLGIETVSPEATLLLKRPAFVSKQFKIESLDPKTLYWGIRGANRQFLDKLVECIKGEFNISDLYVETADCYLFSINIELFQKKFEGESSFDIFRQFNDLKTLRMLESISIPLSLKNGTNAESDYFSDGQFQSVYIYSIVEIFKDRNCITLLDEPDSFLHPEWQFDFLKQVFDITDTAAKNNHVLMSSHSAVTLIPHDKKKIKFFDIKNNYANCYELEKRIAIKKLSSDLIKYSEEERLLSIINAIQIENKPVLFTEGSTDPIILKEAWYKLFDEEMPFIPFYAFSSTYINQLLTDNRIHDEMGGLPIFALFDFDKAYDQWNGLNGTEVEKNPLKGMVKKWASGDSYAIMLPVPTHVDIQRQVIKDASNNETFGGNSCCEIEHLFYGQDATAAYYQDEPCVGGSKIVFKSDAAKTTFAKDVVPTLDAACFEVFRPMFEFIRLKCPSL
ncbi:AAA family ATPase [Trichocoleus sp. FACHB-262]|uniref:AAA family ATPase n=1 Tax=Trichocoleus sp. FACHB-262 TaxID=2692869 RepID=UPI0016871233|nr:AAA family ATPase [Trichocoleus sp. FACHB-262]MBD2121367.1 AAA family ATPase [Trichocoleus sp. FACHB-262]